MEGVPEQVRVDGSVLQAGEDVGLGGSGEKGTVKRHLGGGISRLVGGLDVGLQVTHPGKDQAQVVWSVKDLWDTRKKSQ